MSAPSSIPRSTPSCCDGSGASVGRGGVDQIFPFSKKGLSTSGSVDDGVRNPVPAWARWDTSKTGKGSIPRSTVHPRGEVRGAPVGQWTVACGTNPVSA